MKLVPRAAGVFQVGNNVSETDFVAYCDCSLYGTCYSTHRHLEERKDSEAEASRSSRTGKDNRGRALPYGGRRAWLCDAAAPVFRGVRVQPAPQSR